MSIDIVIGSNYGDEGKGITTDFLSSVAFSKKNMNPVVVRHNGGAQAGHTVQSPNGVRHVFHHFASGTLTAAVTYLSEFFIVNPILFQKELGRLDSAGFSPQCFVHPDAIVTTPFDVMINQAIEHERSGGRHGSCGVGINETVVRNLEKEYRTTVSDFLNPGIKKVLTKIRDEYVPKRMKHLGLDYHNNQILTAIFDSGIDATLFSFDDIMDDITIIGYRYLKSFQNIIFEGAQGLLLDQNKMEYFPHLTRSNTGIENAVHIINSTGLDKIHDITVTYVTRPYLTRHGAGPLNHSYGYEKPYELISDPTNIPHEYQGVIRFADLDIDLLKRSIHYDLAHSIGFPVKKQLSITCMDQIPENFWIVQNGIRHSCQSKIFPKFLTNFVGFDSCLCSFGPSRKDINWV